MPMTQLDISSHLNTIQEALFNAMRLAFNRRFAADSLYPMFSEVVEAFLLDSPNHCRG